MESEFNVIDGNMGEFDYTHIYLSEIEAYDALQQA